MMNAAIPQIESVLKQLEILASQEVPSLPPGADGDALRILAKGLVERYASVLAICQTLSGDLKHAYDVLSDLQLSREPDVERLFIDLMNHRNNIDHLAAWDLAEKTIAFRNKKRSEKRMQEIVQKG